MKEQTTRFWMVRHAPVPEAVRELIYGHDDLPAVLDETVASVTALAEALPRPAVLVTTTLRRSIETARAIVDAGYPAPEPIAVGGLAEQHFGDWQGLPQVELVRHRRMPKPAFWQVAPEERPPGGESFVDVMARVGDALDGLIADHGGKDIVCVAHSGSIRAALGIALGLTPDRALAFRTETLSLTRLDHVHGDGGEPRW
ncbi:MAG: histidine phosphatase family protein, partial [Acetobacterales bacterium]